VERCGVPKILQDIAMDVSVLSRSVTILPPRTLVTSKTGCPTSWQRQPLLRHFNV
jgi:hypothetical protein